MIELTEAVGKRTLLGSTRWSRSIGVTCCTSRPRRRG